MDETLSFGVLGANGRGITEHFDLPVSCVDVLIGSNATSLAGVGGFCVGTHEVRVCVVHVSWVVLTCSFWQRVSCAAAFQ